MMSAELLVFMSTAMPPLLACFKESAQFDGVGLTGPDLDGINPSGAK